ncbi:MAG: helix-turn-helix domain-containing protein [Saprospiraceae bacterium]
MGQAKEAAVRQKIVLDWRAGMSYAALARQYGMSYNTIRSLCYRYQAEGSSGLLPNYGRCGRKVEGQHAKVFRLIRLLKHLHPQWGVPYLVQRIEEKYPGSTATKHSALSETPGGSWAAFTATILPRASSRPGSTGT